MQEAAGVPLDSTLNDRADGRNDLHVNTHQEERKQVVDSDNWIEVRL